jgi:hypothetical protein
MKHLLDAICESGASDSSVSTLMRRRPRGMKARAFPKFAVALTAGIFFGLTSVCLAAAQQVPTGTIELSGGSLAAGIGYTWGTGTLIFEGKEYAVTVDGLSLLNLAASSYTASGTVYNLTTPSDINGTYTAISSGIGGTIAGGAPETTMKNPHGVIIEMTATHKGLGFNLGPNGVTISLK